MADVQFTVDMHEIGDFGSQLLSRVGALKGDVLKRVNKTIADEIIQSARSSAGSRQMRRAAQSLRSARSGDGAAVMSSLRWFMGAELGALRYHQFPTWRGTVPPDPTTGGAGYFLFPSIRANAERYVKEFGDEFIKGLNPAF